MTTVTPLFSCTSTLLAPGLLSLSVKGAEVASLTVNTIQSIPSIEWLSTWIKAYAFSYAKDYPRAIATFR